MKILNLELIWSRNNLSRLMRSIYISLKLVITRLNKVVVLGEFLPGEFWVSFFDEFFWVSFF